MAKKDDKRSKDDLDIDIGYRTAPPTPTEEVKPSRIRRFFSYIGTKAQAAMETKIGKVLIGTALSRSITILFSAAVLSGVFPPAIPFAVTAAVVSLGAVAVAAVIDTVKTRSLRKLAAESDLLVKNRNALSLQEQILKINPELSEILNDRPNSQQQGNNYSVGTQKVLNAGIAVADTVPAATNFALQSMLAAGTGNPITILNAIRTGVVAAGTFVGGGVFAKYTVDIAKALKMHISEERQYVGKYKNTEELRQKVEKQEIQTLALQELSMSKYIKLTPGEKKKKFIELTHHYEAQVKSYNQLTTQEARDNFAQVALEQQQVGQSVSKESARLTEERLQQIAQPLAKKSDSILSDAARAHDPFYVQPTLKPNSELAKALVSEKTKESAKEIASPKVRNLVSLEPELAKYKVSKESSDKLDVAVSKISKDLSKRKKEASYLDPAETRVDKVKTQTQKSKPVKKDIAR